MPRFRVGDADAGSRLDVVLTRETGLSRSRVGAALRDGAATVDGVPAKPSLVLDAGMTVDYEITAAPEPVVEAEALPLTVLYEDDDIVVVDKPAGMVTHPAHGNPGGTLVNALLARYADLPGERVRAGLVHRLDRDTSGLLLVARSAPALTALGRAMQARAIERRYRGIVVGVPRDAEGTVSGAIARDARDRMKRAVRADGKPAVTHYALRETLRGAAELTFRLETGRTHQIRVHCEAMGHPVLNDPLYGRADPRARAAGLPGQALHAERLAFRHPVTRAPLAFEIAPPPAYLATLDALRPRA